MKIHVMIACWETETFSGDEWKNRNITGNADWRMKTSLELVERSCIDESVLLKGFAEKLLTVTFERRQDK
jgi:hypothetical protein